MGLTGLGSATILVAVGTHAPWAQLLAALLYPLAFVVVIVGRAQLFTENTLFPVILALDRRRHVRNTLRLWTVVFVANVLGALLFAVLAMKTSSLSDELREQLTWLGGHTTGGSFGHIFWSGVIGGWIIALMAWLVSAARFTVGGVLMVSLLNYGQVVGSGRDVQQSERSLEEIEDEAPRKLPVLGRRRGA